MRPLPINPYKFQEEINKYAKDIVILFNSTIERYQIFQALRPIKGFVLPTDNARKDKIRPMFTIETEDGSYREPDQSDLDRVIGSVDMSIDLQVKGFEFTADRMERDEVEREEAVAPGVRGRMEWAAKEMYKTRVRKGIGGFN